MGRSKQGLPEYLGKFSRLITINIAIGSPIIDFPNGKGQLDKRVFMPMLYLGRNSFHDAHETEVYSILAY